MNKERFLEELRGYLQILEDQEQEDILEEYAQHIDMKLQKGLSEEEAIRDFGPMKELAAEILEAYHVKPGFHQKRIETRFLVLKGNKAAGEKPFFERAGCFLKEKIVAVFHSIRSGFQWMGRKGRGFAGWLTKLLKSGEKMDFAEVDGSEENLQMSGEIDGSEGNLQMSGEIDGSEGNLQMSGKTGAEQETMGQERGKVQRGKITAGRRKNVERGSGNFFRGIGRGIAALWRLFLAFCLWWLRLMWNVGWLLCSLLCAIIGVIALAAFGALFVLLFQGYPLRGIFLISLGGILCFGALSCGAFSMMIRKKKREDKTVIQKGESEQSGEEVQYE